MCLDGRSVKSPKRNALVVPSQNLAQAVAVEWEAQKEMIDQAAMPLTRLSYGAIDRDNSQFEDLIEEIVTYAGSDLLCYRAEAPMELAERQSEIWQPLLDWAARELGVHLEPTVGVVATGQSEQAFAGLRQHLKKLTKFELAGLHPCVPLTGSTIIGLGLLAGHLSAAEAFEASFLDELWQESQWGKDEEATIRREGLAREIEAIDRFMRAL